MFDLNININFFGSLGASVILKKIAYFIIENKDRIKEKFQVVLTDISNIWQRKSQCNIAYPNTPFTWIGNGFGDHL